MKIRNIIKSLLLSLVVVFAASCDKKLDVDPRQSIDADDALTTPADVEGAVVGCYAIMGRGALYGTSLLMDADLQASSGYCSWRGTFGDFLDVSLKTMTTVNSEASRVWINAYDAINMANTVIDALGVVTDPGQKDQFEGEALFVRGIMHFELVRFYAKPWGTTAANDHLGVVIKTTATKTEEQAFERIPRSTVSQVYAQVIADLTAASNKLPDDNGTRADRFVALAMLSRVYMMQGNYTNALQAANLVIASNKYAMNAGVAAVFDNKNTRESIWEIQQNDQNNAGNSNDGMATFYASLEGIGRADLRMNANFVNLYDPIDSRVSEWYYIGEGARPGAIYCAKWKSFSQNLPVIRIAEMYLTRAECNIRLGTTTGATPEEDLAQIVNPLRNKLASYVNPTLDDVLFERYLELAFEGVRIHDVKRLRLSNGAFAWNADKLVFPIPQSEVDATEGVIIQNLGY